MKTDSTSLDRGVLFCAVHEYQYSENEDRCMTVSR